MSPRDSRPDPLVEVHPDPAALATAVAGELLTRLADAQSLGRLPHVVLTGGSIAEVLYAELGRLAAASEVDWSHVEFWWGDERFVAPDSPDRNALAARRAFLDVVGVDPARVHEMPSTATSPDVHAGAAAYAADLAGHGPAEFEVVLLGMGPDGHVASLFPGRTELAVRDRDTVAVTASPKPPPERISLTLPALNRARSVWLLVSGAAKADAVARALTQGDLPAAQVAGHADTIWFLDRDAASHT